MSRFYVVERRHANHWEALGDSMRYSTTARKELAIHYRGSGDTYDHRLLKIDTDHGTIEAIETLNKRRPRPRRQRNGVTP